MTTESASSIVCWEWYDNTGKATEWAKMAAAGLTGMTVYVVGVPVLFFCVLMAGARLARGQNFLWLKASCLHPPLPKSCTLTGKKSQAYLHSLHISGV